MRDWLCAARAYATLGLESSDHLNRINSSRIQALDAVGQDLESALSRIAAPVSVSGTISHSAVLSGALGYYNDKRQGLSTSMAAPEQAYLVEITSTVGLDRDTPFDLFGGLNQAIPHKTPEFAHFSLPQPRRCWTRRPTLAVLCRDTPALRSPTICDCPPTR